MFKSFLIPVSLLLAGAGVVMLYGLPFYKDVMDHRLELLGYRSALETVDKVERVQSELQSKLASLTPEDMEKVETMMPMEPRAVEDIVEVSNLASQNGVTIVDVVVQETGNEAGELSAYLPFQTLKINYSLVASYENLLSFLRSIERRLRVTDVTSVDILSSGESAFYEVDINTSTYWIK